MPENYAETLHNPAKTAGISCPSLKYLQQMYGRCLHSASSGSADHTRPLALLLCVEAVLVAVTASVPELGAGVGLLIVVPADIIVPTCALVQNQATARVQGNGLFGKSWPWYTLMLNGYT